MSRMRSLRDAFPVHPHMRGDNDNNAGIEVFLPSVHPHMRGDNTYERPILRYPDQKKALEVFN